MKQNHYSPTALLFEAILPNTPYDHSQTGSRFRLAARTLATWRNRAVSRRQLSRLDSRMLNDIGLSDFDAKLEAAKPFWTE